MLAAWQDVTAAKSGRAVFGLRRVAVPTLDGLPVGSVLIKNLAASICGSDLIGTGEICGCEWRIPIQHLDALQGAVGGPGHEVIGEVVGVVTPCALNVGDKVLAMVTSYIASVPSVRSVFEAQTGVDASTLPKQGAFAPFFVSHDCACLPIPIEKPRLPSFNPLWYCVGQPLGTILHAVKKLGSVIGQTVVVFGQGQNGLLLTAVLANAGARRVLTLDRLSHRLEVSARMGASATHLVHPQPTAAEQAEEIEAFVRSHTAGRMADVAVDMVGHQGDTIDLCARVCRTEGTVLLFGLPPREQDGAMRIHYRDFVRNLRYVCSHSPAMEMFELALEMLQQGRLDISPVMTHTVPFARFPAAYDVASTYSDQVIKTVLTFDECAPCTEDPPPNMQVKRKLT